MLSFSFCESKTCFSSCNVFILQKLNFNDGHRYAIETHTRQVVFLQDQFRFVSVRKTCHFKVWKTNYLLRRYSSHSWTCFICRQMENRKTSFENFFFNREDKKFTSRCLRLKFTTEVHLDCVLKKNFFRFLALCVRKNVCKYSVEY